MHIYLDNAATTRPDPAVLRAMSRCAEHCYGNPASWHRLGVQAAAEVERARQTLAQALHAEPDELVFTSGGTEANNLALKGAAWLRRGRGRRVVVSAVEHPSVLAAARSLEAWGLRAVVAGVDREGRIEPATVRRALTRGTVLVSVMHANNEVGTIEPVEEIARLCRARGILFHCDACQSFTKVPIDLRRLRADLLTVNAHKLHGPKGVGALFVRRGTGLAPLLDGGGHEGGRRSGTPNVPAIAGFGAAVEAADPRDAASVGRLRDRLLRSLLRAVPGLRLNGPARDRLCGHLHVMLPQGDARTVLRKLSAAGVYASSGSACASGRPEPSHVLTAMGLSPGEASRGLRLTLSKHTTRAEVNAAARLIARFAAEESS